LTEKGTQRMVVRHIRRTLAIGAVLMVSIGTVLTAGAQVTLPPGQTVHAAARQQADIDWSAVEQALGKSGTMMPGNVFRINMPRSDLSVTVEGVPVKANFALGSYAAFKPMDDGSGTAMVMGDLVLLDEEVQGVMAGLFGNGLQVAAVHNHLNQISPHVMYMHYEGMGDPVQLASGLHAALSVSKTPFGPTPPGPPPAGPQLDADMLQGILGHNGQVNNSVLAISVPRAETVTENGVQLLPAMGVTTALNFQPTDGGKAAITGDFALTADEVNPVASTLRAAGIEVTAVHSHALGDQPRLFYMHFWANDDPAKLATALRSAVDQTNSVPPTSASAFQ
jgi:Domain of Unknown Function (DUF1259)